MVFYIIMMEKRVNLLISRFWNRIINFGRPFVKRFAICNKTVVCLCAVVYCSQTVGWIKMSLGTELGLGPGHIVLDGDPDKGQIPRRGHSSPHFSAHVYCGQKVAHLNNC